MTITQTPPPKLWELVDTPPRLLDRFAAQALAQNDASLLLTLVVARFVHPGLYHHSAYRTADLCETLRKLSATHPDWASFAAFGGDVLRALDSDVPLSLETAQFLVTQDPNPNADLLSTEYCDEPDPELVISPAALDFLLNYSAAWAIGAARSALTHDQFDRLLQWYPLLGPGQVHEFEAAIRFHTTSPYRLALVLARMPQGWVFPVTPTFVALAPVDPDTITRIIPHLDTAALINLAAPPHKYYPHRLTPAQLSLAVSYAGDDFVSGVLQNLRSNYFPQWYVSRLLLRLPGLVHRALISELNWGIKPGQRRPLSPRNIAAELLERCSPAVLQLMENPSASLAQAITTAKILTTSP